jgi:hypothetical protein
MPENPPSWGELFTSFQTKWEGTLDRWNFLVKEILLDWDPLPTSVSVAEPGRPDLPAVSAATLTESMRVDVSDTMKAVADLLNETEAGQPLDEHRLCELFAELARRTVSRGLALRVEAGLGELPPLSREHHRWADCFRRMILEKSLPSVTPRPERLSP